MYCTNQEALTLVYTVNKFCGYIKGSPVYVKTEHQPLRWFMPLKSPTGRLTLWTLQVQTFDLKIDYISGRTYIVADTLSIPPIDSDSDDQPIIVIYTITILLPSRSIAETKAQQLEDPYIQNIIECFENSDSKPM